MSESRCEPQRAGEPQVRLSCQRVALDPDLAVGLPPLTDLALEPARITVLCEELGGPTHADGLVAPRRLSQEVVGGGDEALRS